MRSSRPWRAVASLFKRWRVALGVALFLLTGIPRAQDFGVIGPVYEISEPNLIQVILERLREAEASGTLAGLQRDAHSRVRHAIEDPSLIGSISRTRKPRSFYYDPSIIVPYAITDADGKAIVAPGTRVNPLDNVSLTKRLLFIDARDKTQVSRAKTLLDEHDAKVKVILVGGSYLELSRRWARPVYFDQQGTLTEKLGIRHVPALVTQEGKRLRIDEML